MLDGPENYPKGKKVTITKLFVSRCRDHVEIFSDACGDPKTLVVKADVCVCVLHIKPFFYSSTSSTPSVRTDSSP